MIKADNIESECAWLLAAATNCASLKAQPTLKPFHPGEIHVAPTMAVQAALVAYSKETQSFEVLSTPAC